MAYERKTQKEALSETNASAAQQILDSLFLPVYAVGPDFILEYLNSTALQQVKKKHFEEVQDIKCYSLIHKRQAPCPFCPLLIEKERRDLENAPLEKIIQNIVKADPDQEAHKKNGTESNAVGDIEKSYRIVFAQSQQWLIETIEDITAQQESQNKLLLNENLSVLGVMVSGVSHELNNSLVGMGLNLQNLMANHTSMQSDELTQRLEILRKDLHQASQVVSNILFFSNPSKLHFTRAKMLHTVHKAIATSRRLYPILSRSVAWEVEGKEIIFPFCPQSIERLLINLFRNSLQKLDYKPGKIRVHLERRTQAVHMVVEDNAGGIERAHLKKIFQPFYTHTPGRKGSGLGLSICHSIVREHQGHIHVRSVDNKTRFYISLPLDSRKSQKVGLNHG